MSAHRSILVHGSLIGTSGSVDDALNCRNAGADPSVFEGALGVTWDVLDLCLAYGLTAEQAKGLLTARSFRDRFGKHFGLFGREVERHRHGSPEVSV